MFVELLLVFLVLAVIVFLVVMLWPKMMPNTNNSVYGSSGSTPYDNFINGETSYGVRYPSYTFPVYGNRNYYGYRSF